MIWKKPKWNKALALGDTYGVLDGDYKGYTLIYIKSAKNQHAFCSIFDGKMDYSWIPKKDFDFGLENGIIEFATVQPSLAAKNEIKKIAEPKIKDPEGV